MAMTILHSTVMARPERAYWPLSPHGREVRFITGQVDNGTRSAGTGRDLPFIN